MQRQLGNDYDITGAVKVSSPDTVRRAVVDILGKIYPNADFALVEAAFRDFWKLFHGELPGYKGCDTLYHDTQHTLDMTLAMARLLAGYESAVSADEQLGHDRATVGIVAALFHDSGYILHADDQVESGAEYTQTHVSRSAQFVESYLLGTPLAAVAPAAGNIVHFTGYEIPPAQIPLSDPKHRTVGELLGTADLMAQMADRCYLEKCRDRLFPEFVLGGLAVEPGGDGASNVRYRSGLDLLRKTPEFFQRIFTERLDGDFKQAYRYFEAWFDGRNPYMESIEKNLAFLEEVLKDGRWELLRRRPPAPSSQHAEKMEDTHRLAVHRLRQLLANESNSD